MTPRKNLWLGVTAALLAALIGSAWQLTSRYGVTTTLGAMELACLRYGVPALVLLPLLFRMGLLPQQVPKITLALLVLGGGLPFGLVVLGGAQWAPAAHIGMFLTGSMPLFTALMAWAVLGERVTGIRLAGLLMILAGLLVFGASSLGQLERTWRGDLMFLLAALLWAVYTLAFRKSGLSPWAGAALVNAWSALLLLPLAWHVGVPKFATAPWQDILIQAAGQGVMAGLLGLVTYMAAIARLGAARASLSGALVPLLTGLGGAWFLSEPLSGSSLAAIALTMAGVALGSGAVHPRRAALSA
jgi:drug/metabolite transporter (DMT)-like permease